MLNKLARKVHKNAVKHGWYKEDRNFAESLCLIHSEVSEALEEWRNGRPPTEVYYVDGKPEGIPVELADVLIRVLDLCASEGIDIATAVAEKHQYNKTRPYKHGREH